MYQHSFPERLSDHGRGGHRPCAMHKATGTPVLYCMQPLVTDGIRWMCSQQKICSNELDRSQLLLYNFPHVRALADPIALHCNSCKVSMDWRLRTARRLEFSQARIALPHRGDRTLATFLYLQIMEEKGSNQGSAMRSSASIGGNSSTLRPKTSLGMGIIRIAS